MDMLMTTQWSSWLKRSSSIENTDPYAAYIFAYIALILFCREMYNIPIGDEDLPVDKLNRDYSYLYDSLSNDGSYLLAIDEISKFFKDEPNLRFYAGREERPYHFKPERFLSHLYFLRNVRNNLVHGHKDFEVRSKAILELANGLITALFNEILDREK